MRFDTGDIERSLSELEERRRAATVEIELIDDGEPSIVLDPSLRLEIEALARQRS